MAQRFIACDREQSFLMPPDGRSRPAFDPAMMVALLLYAHARGIRSSRAIERACVEDVAYRVIAAQTKPDHATIARSVERHQATLAGVFGAVLGLCAKAGLVGVNVLAVDGSKVSANTSRETNVDYERLAREILEEHRAVDAAEDEQFGDRRGDELPPGLATSNGRQQWFKEAKRWLDDQRAERAAPIARDRPKRVKEAERRLDEELWTELRAEDAYQRYRAGGRDRRGGRFGPAATPKPYTPPATAQGTINTADPDSRLVKGQHGWLQGYNAQAAANEHQIVIAAEIQVVSPDFGHLEPMVAAARRELQAIGIPELPRAVSLTLATGTPNRSNAWPAMASPS